MGTSHFEVSRKFGIPTRNLGTSGFEIQKAFYDLVAKPTANPGVTGWVLISPN